MGTPAAVTSPWSLRAVWFPALVVAFFGLYLVSKTRLPHSPPSEAQVHEFAELPLAYQGRIMPYDTVARNALQVLSGRQEVIGEQKPGWFASLMDIKQKTPAIFWLLETLAGTDKCRDIRVFRIENLDLLETLGLKPRDGFRYSWNEIQSKPGEMHRQIDLVRNVKEADRTLFQSKVAELTSKLNMYTLLVMSFQSPPISSEPNELNASLERTRQMIGALRANSSPHAVPPTEATGHWTPLLEAEFQALLARATDKPVNPATVALSSLLSSYARNDAAGFNKQLADYRKVLADYERLLVADAGKAKAAGVADAEIFGKSRVNFEVFYNQFSPFYYAIVLYVAAFVLGVVSWIGWSEPLRRASMWLLIFTFALHTFALVGRIYISGRPPVTNLYSAALFIGWAGVLLALVFEWIYRLGLGNSRPPSSASSRCSSPTISRSTATRSPCCKPCSIPSSGSRRTSSRINLGYAATVVAGLFGALYILLAHVFADARRELHADSSSA